MIPFYSVIGDRAWQETRSIHVLEACNGLPADEYGLIEFYCTDSKCDCRRVIFQIIPSRCPSQVLATISFGWETEAFYTRWMGDDSQIARDMAGASLLPMSAIHPLSNTLLHLVEEVPLKDPEYVARLQRHYREFKQAIRQQKKDTGTALNRSERARR